MKPSPEPILRGWGPYILGSCSHLSLRATPAPVPLTPAGELCRSIGSPLPESDTQQRVCRVNELYFWACLALLGSDMLLGFWVTDCFLEPVKRTPIQTIQIAAQHMRCRRIWGFLSVTGLVSVIHRHQVKSVCPSEIPLPGKVPLDSSLMRIA